MYVCVHGKGVDSTEVDVVRETSCRWAEDYIVSASGRGRGKGLDDGDEELGQRKIEEEVDEVSGIVVVEKEVGVGRSLRTYVAVRYEEVCVQERHEVHGQGCGGNFCVFARVQRGNEQVGVVDAEHVE